MELFQDNVAKFHQAMNSAVLKCRPRQRQLIIYLGMPTVVFSASNLTGYHRHDLLLYHHVRSGQLDVNPRSWPGNRCIAREC
jgi:hypothetical protein